MAGVLYVHHPQVPLVLVFLMAGSRFAYRIWKEHRLYSPLAALGEPGLRAALANTFKVTLVRQLVSLPLAVLIAWLLARTDRASSPAGPVRPCAPGGRRRRRSG